MDRKQLINSAAFSLLGRNVLFTHRCTHKQSHASQPKALFRFVFPRKQFNNLHRSYNIYQKTALINHPNPISKLYSSCSGHCGWLLLSQQREENNWLHFLISAAGSRRQNDGFLKTSQFLEVTGGHVSTEEQTLTQQPSASVINLTCVCWLWNCQNTHWQVVLSSCSGPSSKGSDRRLISGN